MGDEQLYMIISAFRSLYDLGIKAQKYDCYDENTFNSIILDLIKYGYLKSVSSEDIKEIKRKVDSEFQIYQPDGIALLDDYDHELDWYTKKKDEIDHYFWSRYRAHLFKLGWSIEVLNKLDIDTLDRLMNYLGDPNANEQFSRKGLVMGDVQSGKTSNYIGLITKAADAGYKVIILLTGTLEDLRVQTQIRVEEGFIGWDVEHREAVGVGLNNDENAIIPKSVTSRTNDFTGNSGQNTLLHLSNDNVPYIFITKKNSKVLKKIRESLRTINIKPPNKQINGSLLIIDDEADNASVNTNSLSDDPTKINAEIRQLLDLFTRSSYVGFTATPFANVFIDPDSKTEMLKSDLFPRDFIYGLNPPSNYNGAEKIFLDPLNETVQLVNDSNEKFPLKHTKDWDGFEVFDSLTEAINAFLLVNAIRDLREGYQKNSHRSMLINISRFINVQEKIEEIVSNIINNIKNAVKQSAKLPFFNYIQNEHIEKLYATYQKHYATNYNWETIFSILYDSIKDIEIFKVPTKNKKKKLNYDKHKETGLRAVVIGGLALSRGLTLEGLTISYLYRNTSTFDVLMQMGRWFGYRNKPVEYGDLCKVWMLPQSKEYFEEITQSIRDLKEDLNNLVKSKKTPKEFGIRVRNESDQLGITNRNKMRTSKKYVLASDLYGEVLETPFISSNINIIKENMNTTKDFITNNEFELVEKSLFLSSVKAEIIIDYLHKMDVHEANRINYFQKEEIVEFIKSNHYKYFDAVIINGDGETYKFDNYLIKTLARTVDLLDNDTIRVSGKHRRLGSPSDTQYGLSKELIKSIRSESKLSSSSFMIEGRNPLLMIYPITVKKLEKEPSNKLSADEIDSINLFASNLNENNLTPIGLGIGFPYDENKANTNLKVYYINNRTKWWNLMIRKDNEEDE